MHALLIGLLLSLSCVAQAQNVRINERSSALRIGAAVASGTATRILFVGTGGVLDDSNLLVFDEANKRLTVGTGSATSAGWALGYYGVSSYAALWPTAATPGNSTFVLASNGLETIVNAPGALNSIFFNFANTTKATLYGTAGAGLNVAAGTATTDVAALSVTRTNNNAAVATGVKFTFTDTTSAAGFLPFQILGGAAGTTNLLSLDKSGFLTLPAMRAGATASTDGVIVRGDGRLGFNVDGNLSGNYSPDSALSRISAGVIGVGTGAVGSVAGTISAAAYIVGGAAGASGDCASVTVVNGIVTVCTP